MWKLCWVLSWIIYFVDSASEPDEYYNLVQVIKDIQDDPLYTNCSLVMSRSERTTSEFLNELLIIQSNSYRTVAILNTHHPTGISIKHWSKYLGISREEQIYSFRTMPPEIKSKFWPGGSCTLNLFLLNSPEHLNKLMLQTVAFVRVRNLEDPFIMHFKRGDPQSMLKHGLASGIKYKVATRFSPEKRLDLQTVCFFCGDGGQPMMITTLEGYKQGRDLYPDMSRDANGYQICIVHYENIDLEHSRWLLQEYGYRFVNALDNAFIAVEETLGVRINKIHVMEPTEEKWEYRLANGSWIGGAAPILSGECYSGVIFSLKPDLIPYLKMTKSMITAHLTFATAMPAVKIRWIVLLQPLSMESWIWLSFTTVACAVVLKCFLNRHVGPASFSSAAGMVIRMLLEQPHDIPDLPGLRFLISSFWVLATVIVCGYKSKLVEIMALPRTEIIPETLEQLYTSDYKCIMPFATGIVIKQLTSMIGNPIIRLFNESDLAPFSMACLDAALRSPETACILHNILLNEVIGHFYTARGHPLLKVAPTRDYQLSPTIGLSNSGILNDASMDFVTNIIESGLYDMWYSQEVLHRFMKIRKSNEYNYVDEIGEPNVHWHKHTAIIFYFWAICLGCAAVTLMIEFFHYFCCRAGTLPIHKSAPSKTLAPTSPYPFLK